MFFYRTILYRKEAERWQNATLSILLYCCDGNFKAHLYRVTHLFFETKHCHFLLFSLTLPSVKTSLAVHL